MLMKNNLWLRLLVLCGILLIFCGRPRIVRASWFGSDAQLLKINDVVYDEADFRGWWREWREPETAVLDNLDIYIDWQLQVQEARHMELDQNRSYQRKVEIFLKSRSLMLLRQEEIDERMEMPESEQLRAKYNATLQPIIDLEILQIADQKQAEEILQLGRAGAEIKDAAIKVGIADPQVLVREQGRPEIVSDFFKPLFADSVKTGHLQLLEEKNGVWFLIKVVAKKSGSDEDFAEFEDKLRNEFIRKQEPALNQALMTSLREKYQPVVNQELLDKIDNLQKDDPLFKESVLTIAEVEVPVWQVVRLLKSEEKLYRNRQGKLTIPLDQLKKMVIANIETQTMVSLEARNRHYELRPPFQSTYEFYCQRRLIKELERVVIGPRAQVSEAEIEAEYKRMLDQFGQADVVEVAWVQLADERLSKLIAAELKQGRDFFKVMEPYFPQGVDYTKSSEEKLQPEIREIVKTLAPGQVSAPVQKNDETFFVKLFRRFGDQHLSLDEVTGSLQQKLKKEKFAKARAELLATFRANSKIVIGKSRWRKLQRELAAERDSTGQLSLTQGEDK